MVFYAPREVYTDQMTVMEMICCSVCITSMICFSLEVKYGNLFSTHVHMHRHRVGARGNATTFPMPWQQLLAELQRLDTEQEHGNAPDLPKVGADLVHVVQVLPKTNDCDDRESLARIVRQAHVRRHIVVRRILEAKARGHRAYILNDRERVLSKSKALPENVIPQS